jgi:hypothetical protein
VWYRALVLVHVLAGIAWLGGGLAIQVTERRALHLGGRSALDRVRRDLAWADSWLAFPAPVVVVGTGVAMVWANSAWRFSQTWIWMTITILAGYQVLALTVGARIYRQVESGAHRSHGADPGVSLIRLGGGLLLMLVGVAALMVFKPL